MTALYRTAEARRHGTPMPFLEYSPICDECNRARSNGNHRACSKKRQAVSSGETSMTETEKMIRSIEALLDLDARGSLTPHGVGGLARDILSQCAELLGQPAEHHRGGLAIPEECPHLIVFDDTEVASLMFSGSGARAAALKKWEAVSTSWNAHLFVRVARNSRDDGHPCATHADPGEIERLREATAYVQRMVDCAGTQPSVATGYLRDILDVLKGSAAPSAPTCGHAACKSLGEPHPLCEFAQGLDATGAAKQ